MKHGNTKFHVAEYTANVCCCCCFICYDSIQFIIVNVFCSCYPFGPQGIFSEYLLRFWLNLCRHASWCANLNFISLLRERIKYRNENSHESLGGNKFLLMQQQMHLSCNPHYQWPQSMVFKFNLLWYNQECKLSTFT